MVLHYTTLYYSYTVQYSITQINRLFHCTTQYFTIKYNIVFHNTKRHFMVKYITLYYIVQHNISLYNMVFHSNTLSLYNMVFLFTTCYFNIPHAISRTTWILDAIASLEKHMGVSQSVTTCKSHKIISVIQS
jgi:hypothetical protein